MKENEFLSADPFEKQKQTDLVQLEKYNATIAQFGLCLSTQDMVYLSEQRFRSLKDTGRVELGEGILPQLVYALSDSPYVTQQNFTQTLVDLQDCFYAFKNELESALSDDELIEALVTVFNGYAEGSTLKLGDVGADTLCGIIYPEEDYDCTDELLRRQPDDN